MELKKSESANLEKKSSLFFLIGLVAALGMTLTAFTAFRAPIAPEKEIEIVEVDIDPDEEIVITDTPIEDTPPPPPPPPAPPVPQIDLVVIEEIDDDVKEPEIEIKKIEPEDPIDAPPVKAISTNTVVKNTKVTTKKVVQEDTDDEDEDEIISVRKVGALPLHRKCKKMVGDKAKMKKCLSTQLSKEIGSNLSDDIEVEEKARVMVSFVVGKDGKITDIKALTGPSHLKSEATRAVKRIRPFEKPAMTNSGKPTRMSYKVPITFTPTEG